jgi:hypothetical protein
MAGSAYMAALSLKFKYLPKKWGNKLLGNSHKPTFAAPKSSLSSVFAQVNVDIGFGSTGNNAGTLSPKKFLKWLKKLLAM